MGNAEGITNLYYKRLANQYSNEYDWCHINNIKLYLDTNLLYVLRIEISICKGHFIVCFKNQNISL